MYSSPACLLLFAVTALAFSLVSARARRLDVLLIASLVFYSAAGLEDAILFAAVVVVAWLSMRLAMRYPERKSKLITGGIVLMAGHLFFWKYAAWLCGEIQVVFPGFLGGRKPSLSLPIGISFFTLQGIAYLVDFSRGEAPAMGFREFVLYKSYFPQLIAGPIVRSRELLPQLRSLRKPAADDFAAGLLLFATGFFKKLVVADRVAPLVDATFKDPGHFSRAGLVLAVLAYSTQIWADFSGYTDMGRGFSRMLGISLPENFLSPYFSRTPSEFWRRWHITLSRWIRDYLYLPLTSRLGREKPWRVGLALVLTMAASGLWHGANWTFVLWGLYHGALLAGERLFRAPKATSRAGSSPVRVGLAIAMTHVATLGGWLVFRAPSLGALGTFLKSLWYGTGTQLAGVSPSWTYFGLLFTFAYQGVTHEAVAERLRSALPRELPLAAEWATGIALGFLLVGTAFLRYELARPFVYFQF